MSTMTIKDTQLFRHFSLKKGWPLWQFFRRKSCLVSSSLFHLLQNGHKWSHQRERGKRERESGHAWNSPFFEKFSFPQIFERKKRFHLWRECLNFGGIRTSPGKRKMMTPARKEGWGKVGPGDGQDNNLSGRNKRATFYMKSKSTALCIPYYLKKFDAKHLCLCLHGSIPSPGGNGGLCTGRKAYFLSFPPILLFSTVRKGLSLSLVVTPATKEKERWAKQERKSHEHYFDWSKPISLGGKKHTFFNASCKGASWCWHKINNDMHLLFLHQGSEAKAKKGGGRKLGTREKELCQSTHTHTLISQRGKRNVAEGRGRKTWSYVLLSLSLQKNGKKAWTDLLHNVQKIKMRWLL